MEEKETKKVTTKTGGFGYSGYVRIKLSRGDKPYKIIEQHNTGTADFFKFILNCVRGVNSPKDRPYYMQLWDKEFNTQIVNTNFILDTNSTPIIKVETDTHENDEVQASFTAFMADSFIAGRSFQGVKIVSYSGVEYARIALDNLVEITGSNTNVAIDWVINLRNVKMSVEG